jgi:hypothetical protein
MSCTHSVLLFHAQKITSCTHSVLLFLLRKRITCTESVHNVHPTTDLTTSHRLPQLQRCASHRLTKHKQLLELLNRPLSTLQTHFTMCHPHRAAAAAAIFTAFSHDPAQGKHFGPRPKQIIYNPSFRKNTRKMNRHGDKCGPI